MKLLDIAEKKLRKNKITLAQYREIECMALGETSTTICSNVYKFFRDLGFKTTKEGVGWRVYV